MFLIVIPPHASAQENKCVYKLDTARILFENGLIEDVPSTLWPCIEEGFSREERISAYKLLVITYLFDGNQTEAERTMQQFIFDYPNYDIRPDDPVEFVYLYESYESVPKYSFGIRTGTNLAQPYRINPQSIGISGDNSVKYHLGLQAAVTSAIYLNRNFALNLETVILQTNHEFINNLTDISKVRFEEVQNRVEVPLYLSYHFNTKEFFPYVFLGGSFNKLLVANGLPERVVLSEDDNETFTGPELDISAQRNNFDFTGLAGFGLRYPLTKGSLFLDFRTSFGLKNHLAGSRFQNTILWSRYYHLDNDFAMIRYSLSFGYVYSFYKPVKIR